MNNLPFSCSLSLVILSRVEKTNLPNNNVSLAWVVTLDMGYGHERAAFNLSHLAYDGVIIANDYPGIPPSDKNYWNNIRHFYEGISRFKTVPIIGEVVFVIFDYFQRIIPFYPKRDLSKPSWQLQQNYAAFQKGLFQDLIDRLKKQPLPLVATFFTIAYAAEYFDYPGDIYITILDADVSRAWAPLDPHLSKIKYFVPNGRVAERLKLYGVDQDNIYLTGFPLPKELVGGVDVRDIKQDLPRRLKKLDPLGVFTEKYRDTIDRALGENWQKTSVERPLTITFAVGGAGAQRELGAQIAQSLSTLIKQEQVRLWLIAGTKADVNTYFEDTITQLGLKDEQGRGINILYTPKRHQYFAQFNHILHETDVLWTKPSELSFYTGLGLPIIMAPPIGSQELYNYQWLLSVGGGIAQLDPKYTHQWLFDWILSGGLAEMAWNGFFNAPTHGTWRIEEILSGEKPKLASLPLIV